MATREVVEISCDRCKRVEYRDAHADTNPPGLTLNWRDRSIAFTDLCVPCMKTISNYVEKIVTALESKSPDRAKKKTSLTNGQAPLPPTFTAPGSTAPDVTSTASSQPVVRPKRANDRPTSG